MLGYQFFTFKLMYEKKILNALFVKNLVDLNEKRKKKLQQKVINS